MREWAALWKPLPKVVFSTTLTAVRGQHPPGDRRPGGGDRAAAGRAGGGRHRDRRRDARRRGRRAGSDRRVPASGLPGAGRRRHPVLPPARAPGGPRAPRDPHLRLGRRLPPPPRAPLADAYRSPSQAPGERDGLVRRGDFAFVQRWAAISSPSNGLSAGPGRCRGPRPARHRGPAAAGRCLSLLPVQGVGQHAPGEVEVGGDRRDPVVPPRVARRSQTVSRT